MLVFKFRCKHLEDIFNCLLLEVCATHDLLLVKCKDVLCRIATHSLERVNDPAFDFIRELIEKNILFAMLMRNRYNSLDFSFRLGKLFDFAKAAAGIR